MEPAIAFASEELVHMSRGVRMWVLMKTFQIITASTSDTEFIAAVIADRRYRDHCAGPFDSQDHHDLHGPYRLETINPDVFEPTTATDAGNLLHAWLRNAICPEHQNLINESLGLVDLKVLPTTLAADSIYQLTVPREGNEHDWGWVVGRSGFYEFLAVDRARSLVTMIVATDD